MADHRNPCSKELGACQCLHIKHTDAAIEAKAREIYQDRNGAHGGWWELNETPQVWWEMAAKRLSGRDIVR